MATISATTNDGQALPGIPTPLARRRLLPAKHQVRARLGSPGTNPVTACGGALVRQGTVRFQCVPQLTGGAE
ncbi:hypothetical protein ACEZDB_03205 [Streptacidiphilus sp. N1-3]|uniref:Uncharacterized protein n=1 Tax=Streptacidiphilus alkalitolerans TaxID=3342712 RepID=A0ABV6WUL7_9ACTN